MLHPSGEREGSLAVQEDGLHAIGWPLHSAHVFTFRPDAPAARCGADRGLMQGNFVTTASSHDVQYACAKHGPTMKNNYFEKNSK